MEWSLWKWMNSFTTHLKSVNTELSETWEQPRRETHNTPSQCISRTFPSTCTHTWSAHTPGSGSIGQAQWWRVCRWRLSNNQGPVSRGRVPTVSPEPAGWEDDNHVPCCGYTTQLQLLEGAPWPNRGVGWWGFPHGSFFVWDEALEDKAVRLSCNSLL